MKIGVPTEIKPGEKRVGMTPENAKKLVDAGHEVVIQKDAGLGAGFSNEEYEAAGVVLVTQEEAWNVELLVKVKEPQEPEWKFFKKDLMVWGFLHLAASQGCVEAMQAAGTTALAGETIREDGVFKLLKPMSAIAGRKAIFMGANYLEAQHGGEGILVSGIDGIPAGQVVIFGGGNAAINATDMALGIQASVVIIELGDDRIKELEEMYAGKNVRIVKSSEETLREEIKKADIFVSTILIPGAKPPKLVKEDMVASMKKGSFLIDISIDQGGTVETIDKYTTHDAPVFEKHGVIHYAVPNMPGAVPRTATLALAMGNIEYLLSIANNGLEETIQSMPAIREGVNIYKGNVTYEGLASSFENIEYKNLDELL